jgi:hypothetical protein
MVNYYYFNYLMVTHVRGHKYLCGQFGAGSASRHSVLLRCLHEVLLGNVGSFVLLLVQLKFVREKEKRKEI